MTVPARVPLSPEQHRYFEHSLPATRSVWPIGVSELDALLPDGGLPRGAVVELAVSAGSGLATSIALGTCRSAQQQGLRVGGRAPWCAFIDPTATLHGPGIAEAGVLLERLLVVRPPLDALSRVATRLAESRIFSVVVIDTMGVPGSTLHMPLSAWPRIVRRLALSVEESETCVVMITDHDARRPLPLPVALRVELRRPDEHRLEVRIGKDKRGRIASPKSIVWARPRSKPLKTIPSFSTEHPASGTPTARQRRTSDMR